MDSKIPVEPIQPGIPPDMIDVMVTLERPASDQLATYNRQEKYELLKESAAQVRATLMKWIEAEALSEQVARVGSPTVFNTLFVTCTPGAAERLAHAPGVVSVLPTGDFGIDLLPAPAKKASSSGSRKDQSDEPG